MITKDVPPGALGVARAQQRNIEGWVARKRAGTASARGRRAGAAAGEDASAATGRKRR